MRPVCRVISNNLSAQRSATSSSPPSLARRPMRRSKPAMAVKTMRIIMTG